MDENISEKIAAEDALVGTPTIEEVENLVDEKYNLAADNKLYAELIKAVSSGKNVLAQNVVLQSMQIDYDWIDTIENGLFSIEQIVKKPKTFIREDRELVSVEKAKRVDSLAVRHLSTHTEYIKEIREDGTIRPSKIMSRQLEQDVAIYENRFVYALVQRLNSFIERRYSVIKEKSKVKDNTVMSYNSSFRFGKADIDYKMSLSVKTPNENQVVSQYNDELIEKLEIIRQRLQLIEGTEFATIMRKEKPVNAPIMKTNILSGNIDYKNCYNLWLMLSTFNSVGYCVDIKEKPLSFDENYFSDLTKLVAASVEAVLANNELRKAIYQGLKYDRHMQKRFKVSRKVNYTVDRLDGKMAETDGDINQYYYDRIKRMTGDISEMSKAYDAEGFEDVNVNFRRFFKGIQKIDNELFADLLKLNGKPNEEYEVAKADGLDKKRRAIASQKKLLKKYKLLTQLKKDEIKLAERREETQEKKLRRMEKDLVRAEKRKAKAKLAKEKAKTLVAKNKAIKK